MKVNNSKRERQKQYRERNRDKLKHREAERRKRIQSSQTIIGPSTSSNSNIVEVNNEEPVTAISPTLQNKRDRQKRYREKNREKLSQREAERRRRLQNATTNDSFVANDSLEYLNELRNKILNKVYTVSVKRGRSKVWQVFGKIETDTGEFIENYVSCRKCRKIFKFTSSTSNLVKHKCYIIMKNEEESNTHPVMANIEPKMKKNLERIVLQWTIENCRPFDVIEDSGMQKLAEFLIATGAKYGQHVDVEDLLPQSTAISKSVAKLYPDYLEKLKTEVSSIRKVGYGLTIDVWRDEYLKATYLFLLIHYIKNGKLVTRLLGLDTLESANYTSDDVKSVTVEILQKFDCTLDDKAIIVTDKSNTMMEAFQSNDRIYCINHLLQSAMDEAIYKTPEIRELLKETKKLFTFLRSVSNTFTSSAENVSPKRWGINFHMLSSLADNWNEALNISKLHDREESRIIENLNLQAITELLNIFKPFEEATKELECESRPTLHLAIVHIHRLMKLCVKNIDDVDIVKSFKVNLLNFFDTIVLKNMTIHHKIALYLFPPANKLISFSQSDKDLVRAECKRIMQTYIDEETREPNAAYSAIQFDDKQVIVEYLQEFNEEDDQGASTSGMSTINSELFNDFVEPNKKMNNTEEKVNNEIRLYEDTSVTLQDNFNLLQWWHLHETQFPLLYKTSCKILAVPATGVAAEKVIVKGRPLIFESRRTGGDVKPDFVNDVLFLHFNVEKNEMFYDMIMDENF